MSEVLDVAIGTHYFTVYKLYHIPRITTYLKYG